MGIIVLHHYLQKLFHTVDLEKTAPGGEHWAVSPVDTQNMSQRGLQAVTWKKVKWNLGIYVLRNHLSRMETNDCRLNTIVNFQQDLA